VLTKVVNADYYHRLAMEYAQSPERIWTVVYGEMYCNLTLVRAG